MKLYIAEKPSLGRAIAEVLPKPHRRGNGCIHAANGDTVSWCIGHLLELAEPQAYDPAFKQWRQEHLPIIPQRWQLQAKQKTKSQLAVLKTLIGQADAIVHAGDPDREGQLLVDQVISFLGVTGSKLDAVQRLLISDLNPDAVKRAIEQLRPNREFIPLSTSALARSRADWLYGINMTRAYTIQGRKMGFDGLLSVGRVQTPVLGLVTRRDLEIDSFISKPFYDVLAHIQLPQTANDGSAQASQFTAKWKPSEACEAFLDEQSHMLSKPLAENVIARIKDKPAQIKDLTKRPKSQAAPLPYSLSALQIDAAKRFGLSAQQVLDCCQSLYERHTLITYPRSDSRHLPLEHFKQAKTVIKAIASNSTAMEKACNNADSTLKSKAFNDSKVTAHHAIIPTLKQLPRNGLNNVEQQVYDLVARQYLCQFFPKHEYVDSRIELIIEGGLFIAKARQLKKEGWKQLFPKVKDDKADQANGDESSSAMLPALDKNTVLHCSHGELLSKQTMAPAHFNDATLLAAMSGISRFVEDKQVRKVLKDTDGLGTEATRAGIIELLFKRQFLQRKGKQIHSTATGRALFHSLPESSTRPDMTAKWEAQLNAISSKQSSYQDFMLPLASSLEQLIAQSKSNLAMDLKGLRSTAGKPKRRSTANKLPTKARPNIRAKTKAKPKAKPKTKSKTD